MARTKGTFCFTPAEQELLKGLNKHIAKAKGTRLAATTAKASTRVHFYRLPKGQNVRRAKLEALPTPVVKPHIVEDESGEGDVTLQLYGLTFNWEGKAPQETRSFHTTKAAETYAVKRVAESETGPPWAWGDIYTPDGRTFKVVGNQSDVNDKSVFSNRSGKYRKLRDVKGRPVKVQVSEGP